MTQNPNVVLLSQGSQQIQKHKSISNSKSSGLIHHHAQGLAQSKSISQVASSGYAQPYQGQTRPNTSGGVNNNNNNNPGTQVTTSVQSKVASSAWSSQGQIFQLHPNQLSIINLQAQQQQQVFDVQGNRKVYYLPKKNKEQEEAQQKTKIQSQRAKQNSQGRVSGAPDHQHQSMMNEQGELQQQMIYQQQQRLTAAKYHQAAMINAPVSNAVPPPSMVIQTYHVHPKAKSNDMMIGLVSNLKQGNQQIQQYKNQVPHNQSGFQLSNDSQMKHFHQTSALIQQQYQSVKNKSNAQGSRFHFSQEPEIMEQNFTAHPNTTKAEFTQQIIPQQQNSSQQQQYGSRMYRQQQQMQHIKHQKTQDQGSLQGQEHPVQPRRNTSPMNQPKNEIIKGTGLPLQTHNQQYLHQAIVGQDNIALDHHLQEQKFMLQQQLGAAQSRQNSQIMMPNSNNQQFHSAGNAFERVSGDHRQMFPKSNQQQNVHQRFGSSQIAPLSGLNNQDQIRNVDQRNNQDQLKSNHSGLPQRSQNSQFMGQNNIVSQKSTIPVQDNQRHLQQAENVMGNDTSFENYNELMAVTEQSKGFQDFSPRDNHYILVSPPNILETSSNLPVHGIIQSGNAMPAQNIDMRELINLRESFLKRQQEEEGDRSCSINGKNSLIMMIEGNQESQNLENANEYTQNQLLINQAQQRQLLQQYANLSAQLAQVEGFGSGRSHYSNQMLQQQQSQLQYLQQQQQTFENLLIQQYQEQAQPIIQTIKQILDDVEDQPTFSLQKQNILDSEDAPSDDEIATKGNQGKLYSHVKKLTQLLREFNTERCKEWTGKSLGFLNLIQMLEQSQSQEENYQVLQLINIICENNGKSQEMIAICGFIPFLIKFSSNHYAREIQIEVAYYIGQMIAQSNPTAVQIFISHNGQQILSDFLDYNYAENSDLVSLALSFFDCLTKDQGSLLVTNMFYDDLCNMLARVGIVEKICQIIPSIIHSVETSTVLIEHSQSQRFLEKAFDTLQNLLESNQNLAKSKFCNESILLKGFIPIIQKNLAEPSPITLNIIKRFIKLMQLATFSPHTYQSLEKCNIIKLFVEMLQFFMQDSEDHSQQLQHIYDILKLINVLCKLSPQRAEQAAVSTVLMPLKELSSILHNKSDLSRSKRGKLYKYMLSIIQELIVANSVTRSLLHAYQIQSLLLSVLQSSTSSQQNQSTTKDQTIIGKVLDLFVLWLQTESSQIENFLAKKQTLETIFNIFIQMPRTKVYLCVFNAINRMVSLSLVIAKSLSTFPQLIEKLVNQLAQVDNQLTQSFAVKSKNSESARSANENAIGGQESAGEVTGQGQQQMNEGANSRNSQLAQQMKELMEIFQNLILKGGNEAAWMTDRNNNFTKVITKVIQTAEQSNLVILQSIAQNILSSYNLAGVHQSKQRQFHNTSMHIAFNSAKNHMLVGGPLPHSRAKSPFNQ